MFAPTPGAGSTGLELLASAALAHPGGGVTLATPNPSLALTGPFNPAASLSTKVTKKILDLEFVEMAEVTLDHTPDQVPGRPPHPGRPPIMDISQWVERYSLMAAVMATRFPHKAPELFAYQASIIRAERNYEAGRWVTYDRQFRREALARRDLNWSTPDPRLYSEDEHGPSPAVGTASRMTTHPNGVHRTRISRGWLGCQAQHPGRVLRSPQPADPLAAPMSCAAGSTRAAADWPPVGIRTPAGAVGALTRQSLAARVTSALGPLSEPLPHRVRARGPLLAASKLEMELGQINIMSLLKFVLLL